jgi:hypothetical protein
MHEECCSGEAVLKSSGNSASSIMLIVSAELCRACLLPDDEFPLSGWFFNLGGK